MSFASALPRGARCHFVSSVIMLTSVYGQRDSYHVSLLSSSSVSQFGINNIWGAVWNYISMLFL